MIDYFYYGMDIIISIVLIMKNFILCIIIL